MKIDTAALSDYLPFYVPAIVAATMATCEAAALKRELTPDEIQEAAERVAAATCDFMRSYKTLLKRNGEDIGEDEYIELHQRIYNNVFSNAWALIQRANGELREKIRNDNKSISLDAGSLNNKTRTAF